MNPPRTTRWAVRTLPRTDDITFNLTLSTPTDDPEVLAAIESAAAAAGMLIYRVQPPTDTDIERGNELAKEHGW